MLGESSNRRRETTRAQLRGMKPAGKVPKLIDSLRDLLPCMDQTLTALERGIALRACRAERLEQFIQTPDRAPAQTLRESAPLGFASIDETSTGCPELDHLAPDFRLKLGVPRSEACCRSDGVNEGRVVQHRRVVDEHRDYPAITLDWRNRASE